MLFERREPNGRETSAPVFDVYLQPDEEAQLRALALEDFG
jgi:hypothetical protein